MMKKFLTLLLTFIVALSVFGCGGHDHVFDKWGKDADKHWKICSVEGCTKTEGSANHDFSNGNCICGQEKVLSLTSVAHVASTSTPIDAVVAGSSDVAVVDRYIADYYISQRGFNNVSVLDVDGIPSTAEMFSFITKKDSDFTDYFNAALYKLQEEGVKDLIRMGEERVYTLDDLANMYGLGGMLAEIPNPNFDLNTPPQQGSDYFNYKNNGDNTIHIYIAFPDGKAWMEPLGWQTHAGIEGFMFYVAQAAGQILGLDVSMAMSPGRNLEWKDVYKINSDDSYHVICGPITSDLTYFDPEFEETKSITDMFDLTVPYMINEQVLVVTNDKVATYPDLASLLNAKFVAESGSAGENFVKTALKLALVG